MFDNWEGLEHACMQCRTCSLCNTRHHVVFGVGNRNAEVLFIGEGPGENEDLQGEPFVGRGGQLLDKMLNAIDLDRNRNIYIANIVKCRPPQNRDPFQEEQEACIVYLKHETILLRPKIIVCLGRVAAQRIIRPDFRITREHGSFLYRKNTWLTAVYHPSAILRDPLKMEETREDFRKIRGKWDEILSGGAS